MTGKTEILIVDGELTCWPTPWTRRIERLLASDKTEVSVGLKCPKWWRDPKGFALILFRHTPLANCGDLQLGGVADRTVLVFEEEPDRALYATLTGYGFHIVVWCGWEKGFIGDLLAAASAIREKNSRLGFDAVVIAAIAQNNHLIDVERVPA